VGSLKNKNLSLSNSIIKRGSFASEIDLNRYAGKIVKLPELVLDKAFVRISDILRQITEKHKGRVMSFELGDILDFYLFTLVHRGRGFFKDREQLLVKL
jgi:predicted membrane GTPase involved in stress response